MKILDFGLARAARRSAPTSRKRVTTRPHGSRHGDGHGRLHGARAGARRGRSTRAPTSSRSARCSTRCSSGERAFKRDTAAETMTAILREEPPDLLVARADLPPALERIVRHCLEKNPGERFQTARDVAFALEALSSSGPAARRSPQPSSRSRGGGHVNVGYGWPPAPRWRSTAAWLAWNANRPAGAGTPGLGLPCSRPAARRDDALAVADSVALTGRIAERRPSGLCRDRREDDIDSAVVLR